MKGLPIALGACLFLIACSSDVSREDAAKIIAEHYNYPRAEYAEGAMFYVTEKGKGENLVGISFNGLTGQKMVDISDLIEDGYIIKDEGQIDVSMPLHPPKWKSAWKYSFSDKVNDLLKPGTSIRFANRNHGWHEITFKAYDIEFGSVSGIRYTDDKTKAIVVFDEDWVNESPLLLLCPRKPKIQSKRQVTLHLFDDGWRVAK